MQQEGGQRPSLWNCRKIGESATHSLKVWQTSVSSSRPRVRLSGRRQSRGDRLPRLVLVQRAHGSGGRSLAAGQKTPISLAADTSGVYWMNAGDGTIRRSTRDELPIYTVASGFNAAFTDLHVRAIALTSRYVVWITADEKVLRADK